MRMVPERPRLIGNGELVLERMTRRDWALANERRAICPNRAPLEYTVPVLQRLVSPQSADAQKEWATNDGRAPVHGVVLKPVDDVDLELVTLCE
jgi:hypothetical protein